MRCFHYEEEARFLASPADCLWNKQHTVFLIITTAPNKPKVGVSEGIQNKHCAPQRHPAYFKKQSKKKTSWRQPAEHEGNSPSLLFPADCWHQGWCSLLYSVVLKGSMHVSVLPAGLWCHLSFWFLRILLNLTRVFALILLWTCIFT